MQDCLYFNYYLQDCHNKDKNTLFCYIFLAMCPQKYQLTQFYTVFACVLRTITWKLCITTSMKTFCESPTRLKLCYQTYHLLTRCHNFYIHVPCVYYCRFNSLEEWRTFWSHGSRLSRKIWCKKLLLKHYCV